jgi:hypothetical protein
VLKWLAVWKKQELALDLLLVLAVLLVFGSVLLLVIAELAIAMLQLH